ncbi:MAG: tetratricopeptide repeat protein [Aureliella sp.]
MRGDQPQRGRKASSGEADAGITQSAEQLEAPGMRSDKRPGRLWFRVAAIALGLMPLILLEVACRYWAPSQRQTAIDPYVDLNALRPLFEFDDSTREYGIGTERLHLFAPARFSADKSPKDFRVFALGGSTTQGEPYSTPTAFPKWLEIRLQAMMPSRRVEVINCGGLSYASYRVAAICREVLEYQPDLIVVYSAHNEYLERRSYKPQASASLIARVSRNLASCLKSVQFVQQLVNGPAERSSQVDLTEMSAEVDALLDYQGGLEDYRRGSDWQEGVVEHYQWNMEMVADSCEDASVPAVFVIPTSNILDCPPMKFEVDPELSPSELGAFNAAWEESREVAQTDRSRAIKLLEEAIEIDSEHAGALFLLGRLYSEQRDYEQAKLYLESARDADVCPLRATSEIVRSLRTTLRGRTLVVADGERLFEELSPNGLVGDRWLVDHIHPSVAGHQRLADLIGDELVAEGMILPEVDEANWSGKQREMIAQHLASLGEEYYHRGKQRLRGLQLWTQGRAKKVRSESSSTE